MDTFLEIDPELFDGVVRPAALQRFRHLAEHQPNVFRRLARVREFLLQDDEVAHSHADIGGEVIELPANIERLFEMIEAGRHHACLCKEL